MKIYRYGALLICCWLPAGVYAVDPGLDWYTIESEHFRVHFHQGAESLAQRAAGIAEQAHHKLTPLVGWRPADKTELVLSDEVDDPNGLATPFPYNKSLLYIAPPRELSSLEDFADWLELLITHEYTHILHLDKARGFWQGARSALGRMVFFFPNLFQPLWIIEGYATHLETDHEQHIGRGQSAYFDMIMRTEVANGLKPLAQVNLPIREWPAGHTRYAYGVHFFEFVAARYGASAIKRHIDTYSGNFVPFRLNGVSRRAYGKDIKTLWAEYQVYLRERYQPQLNAIQRQGLVAGRPLTTAGFFLESPRLDAAGGVYYVQNTGYQRAEIVHLRPGAEPESITDVHGTARIDFHPRAGLLVAQPELCDEYNFYWDIYRIAPGQHRPQRLTTCGRYVFAAWSPAGDRIAAVRNNLGASELHLLSADGARTEVMWRGDGGEILSYLDWSPLENKIIAVLWRAGRWDLELFDPQTRSWTAVTADDDIQSQPSYTADGRWIVYSSERGGVYNIWRFDTRDGTHTKLTNVSGGAFDPAYDPPSDTLYYSGYGASGFDLYQLQNTVAADDPGSAAVNGNMRRPTPIPAAATGDLPVRDYTPWSSLRPRWWLPILGYYSEGLQIGAATEGTDALGIHRYSASLAYHEPLDSAAGFFGYGYAERLNINLIRELDIDLIDDGDEDMANDPVARARAHDIFEATYLVPFNRYDSSWNLLAYAGRDRDHDLEAAQLLPPVPESEDNLLGAALVFGNARRFPFSISPGDGRQVRLVFEDSHTLGGDFSGDVYTLDWREFIPLGGQHVAALRLAAGWGTDRPSPFELGGEEGVLDRDNIFNRRRYSLRGYPAGLSTLSGRRMRLGSAEWRFPLANIERTAMAPPIGILQLSGSLFYETGAAWNEGRRPEGYFDSKGIEINTELVIGYGLLLDLHAGYARGEDAGGEDRWYLNFGAPF